MSKYSTYFDRARNNPGQWITIPLDKADPVGVESNIRLGILKGCDRGEFDTHRTDFDVSIRTKRNK